LVNARVGRQAPELLAAMQVDQMAMPKSIVIFNLGNNNKLTEDTTKKIFEVVKNQPKIIVVNTAVPRPWKDDNNKLIAKITSEYLNAKLIDWNQISKNHPEFFAPDGVHLSPT
ncbi:MAG: acyltransferase, partial [Candidatus Fonsibacter sp.]